MKSFKKTYREFFKEEFKKVIYNPIEILNCFNAATVKKPLTCEAMSDVYDEHGAVVISEDNKDHIKVDYYNGFRDLWEKNHTSKWLFNFQDRQILTSIIETIHDRALKKT